MIRLITGSTAIFSTWVLLALLLTGVGLGVRRLFGLSRISSDDCRVAGWVGFGLVILFLQMWHLFLPVNAWALGSIAIAGVSGLWLSRDGLGQWLSDQSWRRTGPVVVALSLVGLWVANWAMGDCLNFDSGLYHLQAVRWNREYPIVPGLGNLHGRFAFNNAGLLFDALLNAGPWRGGAYRLANQFLYFLMLCYGVSSAFRFARSTSPGVRAACVFDLVLLVPATWMIVNVRAGCFATDHPSSVVAMVVGSRLFGMLVAPRESVIERAFEVVAIGTLAAAAVCLKVITIGYCAGIGAVAVGVWLLDSRSQGAVRRKALVWSVAIASVMAGTWLTRSVVLSGYPAYPSTVAPVPVDWRVPVEQARAEKAFAVHFARFEASYNRQNVAVLRPGWGWIRPWAARLSGILPNRMGVVYPGLLAGASLLAWLGAYALGRRKSGVGRGWWMLAPPLLGIGFWFVTAPLGRFSLFAFWTLAATAIAQTLSRVVERPSLRTTAAVLVAAIGLSVGTLFLSRPGAGRAPGGDSWLARLKYSVLLGPSDLWFNPLPSPELDAFDTRSGLTLWVPAGTVTQCFDSPLPCTPYPAANLSLRRPGDLGSGFRTDGRWEATRWPKPNSTFLEEWRAVEAETHAGQP